MESEPRTAPSPAFTELDGNVFHSGLTLHRLRSNIQKTLENLFITIYPNEFNWCGFYGTGSIKGDEFEFAIDIYGENNIHIVEFRCFNNKVAYSAFIREFSKLFRVRWVSGSLRSSTWGPPTEDSIDDSYFYSFGESLSSKEYQLEQVLGCKSIVFNPKLCHLFKEGELGCNYLIPPLLTMLNNGVDETAVLVAIVAIITQLATHPSFICVECRRALHKYEMNYMEYPPHVQNELNLCIRALKKLE
jgi:hypothetical protein